MESKGNWIRDSVDGMPVREECKCIRCGDHAKHVLGYVRGEREQWVMMCGPHAQDAVMTLKCLDIPHIHTDDPEILNKGCKRVLPKD